MNLEERKRDGFPVGSNSSGHILIFHSPEVPNVSGPLILARGPDVSRPDPAEINREIPQKSFAVFQIQIPLEAFFNFRDITIEKWDPIGFLMAGCSQNPFLG